MAAVVVSALAIGGTFDRSPADVAATPTVTRSTIAVGEPMVPVGSGPVRAAIALTGVAWGTKLDLTCTYAAANGGDGYHGEEAGAYGLFVRTRAGAVEQVATWKALPGRTMRLSGATATGRTDITGVEVRTSDGRVVLTLPV